MNRYILIALMIGSLTWTAISQIAVNPTGVNVNSQNPTTVFLTFGPIPPGYTPAEAIWCGELIPAIPPAIGQQCRPDTIYGSLPIRYNQSTASGSGGFTDIMAIPPSVARRAYQAAVNGASAGFFYVRRFVSNSGGPDQFVNVTCRMTGGGARVPFSLTDVDLKTPNGEPILFLKAGEAFPKIRVDIQYNGTGRLKGRWEIVQPGEDPPLPQDLLTEGTLPIEARGTQRRYTQVARFNHFLPPSGKFSLELEGIEQIPKVAGQYLLLLRVEAVDDKESDSNLAAVGVGPGVVHSGAVASFPMPTLKFFIVGDSPTALWESTAAVLPAPDVAVNANEPLVFTWKELESARIYRLEITDAQNSELLSAILVAPTNSYRVPSWFGVRAAGKTLAWRVTAIGDDGKAIASTRPRSFTIK